MSLMVRLMELERRLKAVEERVAPLSVTPLADEYERSVKRISQELHDRMAALEQKRPVGRPRTTISAA